MSTELGAGAWSYFGDPRAISHDGHTFTGWISTTGNVWVAHLRPNGSFTKRVIYKGLGVDDHNNPSLVFRPDGRIAVFFSPHSGRVLPPPKPPPQPHALPDLEEPVLDRRLLPRAARQDQRAGRARLHLPQPDPAARQAVAVLARRRLEPDVLLHAQRQGLGAGPRAAASPTPRSGPTRSTCGDGKTNIHGIFTEGHANHFHNSLYYLRYENMGFFGANGRRIGSLRNVPFPISKLERIYRFTKAKGSAWPHDIALDLTRRPRIVYTRRVGDRDTFFYAYNNGERWISRVIIAAGPGFP